ncbi:MAG: nucleoside-diphosphate kinase, partial [Candidatus Marinimicrobia bacterium]|nr:nucleoside-diphosphate kinase [Candidatus Neomarinimicrobiota bacterium]
ERFTGKIIDDILQNNFDILAIKKIQLKKEEAEKFYQIHKGKFFYNDLIKFMTSGPCVVLVLSKENAVKNFRNLIGNTDPEKAKNKSIRHEFGLNNRENAIHGSDSLKNSKKEVAFFFLNAEIINI